MPREHRLLEEAIDAVKAGRRGEARRKLAFVLRDDPLSERAWIWMSRVVEDETERRDCLMHVLAINPRNGAAQRDLARLLGQEPGDLADPTSRPPAVAAPPIEDRSARLASIGGDTVGAGASDDGGQPAGNVALQRGGPGSSEPQSVHGDVRLAVSLWLVPALTAFLNGGLALRGIHWLAWVALGIGAFGSYLCGREAPALRPLAATGAPLDADRAAEPPAPPAAAWLTVGLGLLLWCVAVGIILLKP